LLRSTQGIAVPDQTLTKVHLPDIIAFMSDSAQDSPVQTMTVVGKALVMDDSTALLLGLLGFSATKLWNTAVWHTRKVWADTGEIPTYPELDVALKQEHPLWYRRLHSQSSQAILEELRQSYQSWFALRKKGDGKSNPPGFRRKLICQR
jgi:putative transposase